MKRYDAISLHNNIFVSGYKYSVLAKSQSVLCFSVRFSLLSWHLYQVLQSLEYTHLSEYHSGMLHSGFASQLEGMGLWHWAAFVLLHIQDLDKYV